MFQYACNHPVRKALLTIANQQNFTPLNLAAKMGRKDLFEKILKIRNIVRFYFDLFSFSNLNDI